MIADIKWNDLKIILEISRSKSLSEAGQNLRINQTTVSRRLYSLEEILEVKLFEQIKTGLIPTDTCKKLIKVAEKIEGEVFDFSVAKVGAENNNEGVIRLATTDFLICHFSKLFIKFQNKYPDIKFELITSNEFVDLTKREADVSISFLSNPPDPKLTSNKVGQTKLFMYQAKGLSKTDQAHNWIDHDDSSGGEVHKSVIQKLDKDAVIKVRDDSAFLRGELIRQGVANGMLPAMIGEKIKGIEKLQKQPQLPNLDVWILTHPDIAKSKKIQTFIKFFVSNMCKDPQIVTS